MQATRAGSSGGRRTGARTEAATSAHGYCRRSPVGVVGGEPEAPGVVDRAVEVLVVHGGAARRGQADAARGDAGEHLQVEEAQRRAVAGLALGHQPAASTHQDLQRRGVVVLAHARLGHDGGHVDIALGLGVAGAYDHVDGIHALEARHAACDRLHADRLHEGELARRAAVVDAVKNRAQFARRRRKRAFGVIEAAVRAEFRDGRLAAGGVDAGGAAHNLGRDGAAQGVGPVLALDAGVERREQLGLEANPLLGARCPHAELGQRGGKGGLLESGRKFGEREDSRALRALEAQEGGFGLGPMHAAHGFEIHVEGIGGGIGIGRSIWHIVGA